MSERTVSVIDICVGLGWIASPSVDRWRRGRVACLEDLLPVDSARIADAQDHLRRWAEEKGLTPQEKYYPSPVSSHPQLRFSKSGDLGTEHAWATTWLSPELPPKTSAPAGQTGKAGKPAAELVVIMPLKNWTCAECGGTGDLLIMDDAGPLCLTCADLDHLVFLAAGDAALIRTRGCGGANGTGSGGPARMWNTRTGSPAKSAGCTRAARPDGRRRSPRARPRAGADGRTDGRPVGRRPRAGRAGDHARRDRLSATPGHRLRRAADARCLAGRGQGPDPE
jgi:hypothetical protein